jgi:Zn-dependent protease
MEINLEALRLGSLYFIVMVCSLSCHEWGHAIAADKLGDDTPRLQGRVTLFPLAHIDWIGTILIPGLSMLGMFGGFSMIGWAKPVYINPANFRRRMFDQSLVTIAGPGVNLVLALIAVLLAVFVVRVVPGVASTLEPLCWIAVKVNVGLMVFNLLPIPPLDGSKFLMYWFGMGEEAYYRMASYGGFVLLILLNLPPFRVFLSKLFLFALGPFFRLFDLLT